MYVTEWMNKLTKPNQTIAFRDRGVFVCAHCCTVSCEIIAARFMFWVKKVLLNYTICEFLMIFFPFFFMISAFGSNVYPFFFQNNC